MKKLLEQIRSCKVCEKHLVLGVNPVIAGSVKSKIIIIGQAPGRIVHMTGIPWSDRSGDNLRKWLGIDKLIFYDSNIIALVPMGFCFPGKGISGDNPPSPECAPLWHHKLLKSMPDVKLTLLVGQYAQQYYLKENAKGNLTETVRHFETYLPKYFPLPHPSPRNNIWQAKNEWFTKDLLPKLKAKIMNII